MEEYEWDSKIEYLKNTRNLYYNDDYLAFLVRDVWKLHRPVHIVDYGCGYGYLGLALLPLLPEGTTYTGIDKGHELVKEARKIFSSHSYETEFIQADIAEVHLERSYDIAVCHAFLLHMPDPLQALRKMTGSVIEGGRIICFEPHWISTMANYHLPGLPQSDIIRLGLLQTLFEKDTKRTGKDGNIGIKLPTLLSQLGVQEVACRVSDKVNFMDSAADPALKLRMFQSIREDGFGADPGAREAFVANLVNRGVPAQEAEAQFRAELLLFEAFSADSNLTWAPSMKITYGTVS